MKKFYLILATVTIAINAQAQILINDSVSMNPGYTNEIYYNFYSGAKASAPIKNWDLAFCINNMEVGIRVNAINGVNLYAIPGTDTSGWATLDSAGYLGWQELHNSDTSYYYGAFNNNANGGTFDFSWGTYDLNTHEVIGDSLFLIKVTDLQSNVYFKKLWIIKRANNATHDWIFRYANLDNSGDSTVTIPAVNFTTKNFIYYSIVDGLILDREPANTDWDILFTRYTTDIGGGIYYPVAGTYSNIGVQVADVRPVDVSTTNSDAPYLNLYSTNLSEIGYDWKSFNMSTNLWEINDSLVYFVKTKAGEVYKLVMTGFDGAATGNVYFNKTLIFTTGIESQDNLMPSFYVYPNPVEDNTMLVYNAVINEEVKCTVYDLAGRSVLENQVSANSGLNKILLNTTLLPKGIYTVEINSNNKHAQSKLVKL